MSTKMSKVFGRLISAVLFIGISTAAQAQLEGSIGFASVFTPGNNSFATTTLGAATSLDYNGDEIQNSSSAQVTQATGDFAAEGITTSNFVTVYDFVFNPFPALGVDPVWSISSGFSDFSFALTSVSIILQNSNFLILEGTGLVSVSDGDSVAGTWSFSGNTVGSEFNFSAGSAVTTPIPEPEIYAMMVAGLGLMGFVARRRKQFV